MSAREIIAAELSCGVAADISSTEVADYILEALTAAGYRILPPGALDPETLEAAAKVADEWQATGDFYDDGQKDAIASAIRALQHKEPS